MIAFSQDLNRRHLSELEKLPHPDAQAFTRLVAKKQADGIASPFVAAVKAHPKEYARYCESFADRGLRAIDPKTKLATPAPGIPAAKDVLEFSRKHPAEYNRLRREGKL